MTPEQQQKMRDAMTKAFGGKNPAEMSAEERTAAFAKMREEMQKAGVAMPARGERKAGEGKKGGETKEGEAPAAPAGGPVAFGGMRGPGAAAGAEGGGDAAGGGGRRRAQGGEGAGGGDAAAGGAGRRRGQGGPGGPGGGGGFGGGGASGGYAGFTQKELDTAKLPPPPEESANQLDVLLRPGLLADVEIIVEKIPNAIYIPAQAIFEKEGKSLVYVKQGNKFVAREVKLLKRSESLMIIAEGLKAGEEISMQDPNAKPSDKKKKGDGGGSAAPAMPMGMGGKKG